METIKKKGKANKLLFFSLSLSLSLLKRHHDRLCVIDLRAAQEEGLGLFYTVTGSLLCYYITSTGVPRKGHCGQRWLWVVRQKKLFAQAAREFTIGKESHGPFSATGIGEPCRRTLLVTEPGVHHGANTWIVPTMQPRLAP